MVNKENLNQLNKKVKNLLNEFNKTQSSNMEIDFIKENKGKTISLIMENDNELKGKLVDIDKFRILIEVDDKINYIFKHSVVGYFANQ